MAEQIDEIPKERLEQFREDENILLQSSSKMFAILNDPILLASHRADSLLEDIANPTRPRVNLERDGFEIKSGNVGLVSSVDRF
jgi:hypothetical protein